MRTTSLRLQDQTTPPAPEKRKVIFKAATETDAVAHRVVVPAPAGSGDPTLGGATLVVYNATAARRSPDPLRTLH